MKKLPALLIALALPVLGGVSCAQIRAKSALKDGNKQYKEENFKRAIELCRGVVLPGQFPSGALPSGEGIG